MIHHLKIILLLIIFLSTSSTTTLASLGKNIYQQSINSLVYIEAYDSADRLISQGSGFYIEKHKFVTNFHVIKNSTYLLLYDINGKFTRCNTVSAYDFDKDLAILKANSQSKHLNINYKDISNVGDNIFVISSPRGFKFTISDGILSGNRNINNVNLYQMTAPISPGSSGGAVFDEKGNVIGIASSYFKDGQNINFAIPISYTKDLIKHNNSILLSDIEDPALTLNNIFLTIFEKIYHGMPEEDFLDALQGCKYLKHERTKGIGTENKPGSENKLGEGGFFSAIEKVMGSQNNYKINQVKVFDIYFDFRFTFNENKNNILTYLYADSETSQDSKYYYFSIIEYFTKKFSRFKKISEKDNNTNSEIIKQQIKSYDNFFTEKVATTSWMIYDTNLSVSLIQDEKIRISWKKIIPD